MDFEGLPSPVLVDSVGASFCWAKAKIDDSSTSRPLASSFASLVVDVGTGGGRGGGDCDFSFGTAFLSRQRCAEDKEKLAITSAVIYSLHGDEFFRNECFDGVAGKGHWPRTTLVFPRP